MLLSLPDELLATICTFCAQGTLYSLASTSHVLGDVAARIMYANVELNGSQRVGRFIDCVSSGLVLPVRYLCIRTMDSPRDLEVLKRCARTLTMLYTPANNVQLQHLVLFKHTNPHRLTHLGLSGYMDPTDVANLLSTPPTTLQHLHIDDFAVLRRALDVLSHRGTDIMTLAPFTSFSCDYFWNPYSEQDRAMELVPGIRGLLQIQALERVVVFSEASRTPTDGNWQKQLCELQDPRVYLGFYGCYWSARTPTAWMRDAQRATDCLQVWVPPSGKNTRSMT